MTGNKIMSITKNQLHDRIKDLQVRAYNISEKLNNAGNKEYESNLFIHSTGNNERMDYGVDSAWYAKLSNKNESVRDNLEVIYRTLIDNDYSDNELKILSDKLEHYAQELAAIEQEYHR